MFRTTCSNCGKECEVPFKPNGSKPVFCSDCFEKNGGEQRRFNDRDYANRRPNFDRPQFNDRPQHHDRPQRPEAHQENRDQFAALNAKLDRIITLLTPNPVTKSDSSNPAEQEPVLKEKKPRKLKSTPTEETE